MIRHINMILQRLPDILCIEKPGELRVDVDNMNIPFLVISNDCLVVAAGIICLEIDAKRAIDTEFESMSSG